MSVYAYVKELGVRRFVGVAYQSWSGKSVEREVPAPVAAPIQMEKLPKDLSGKVFAITGCTSGIGLSCAKMLAARNASILMLNRDSDRAKKALAEVQKVVVSGEAEGSQEGSPGSPGEKVAHVDCNLMDFASVRACSAAVNQHPMVLENNGLYALICNAGVMALKADVTADGYDVQMQTNHLSHFLLTAELFSSLRIAAGHFGDARVVQHSSGARNYNSLPLNSEDYMGKTRKELEKEFFELAHGDLSMKEYPGLANGDKDASAKWSRYCQSKMANICFTYALGDYIASLPESDPASKIKSTCAHPGATHSGLQGRIQGANFLDRFICNLAVSVGHHSDDGAMGIVRGAIDETAKNMDFYGPSSIIGEAELLPTEYNYKKYDSEAKADLWKYSCKAVGVKEAEW